MTARAARLLKTLTLTATLTAIAALALAASSASAASARQIEVPSRGPGPEQFDSITVQQYGPKRPDQVLVLMPGTAGGAGDFTANAKELVKKVDGLAGLVARPPQPGARGHRHLQAGARRARSAPTRPSTTTSAGSPTAARQPTTTASSTPRRFPSRSAGA